MVFMAFGDGVCSSTNYNILNELSDHDSDEEDEYDCDDETELLLLEMHEKLKETCERNRKL